MKLGELVRKLLAAQELVGEEAAVHLLKSFVSSGDYRRGQIIGVGGVYPGQPNPNITLEYWDG